MSNVHKKISNENYEDAGRLTSRSVSKHGLKPGPKYYKKYFNRIGKRGAAALALKDES